MTATRFIAGLVRKGVELRLDRGQLRYRATRGVLTPSLLEEIAERKAEIIASLDEHKQYIRPSIAQERLWFFEQLGSESLVYNLPIAVELEGSPDIDALQRSINKIIQRH